MEPAEGTPASEAESPTSPEVKRVITMSFKQFICKYGEGFEKAWQQVYLQSDFRTHFRELGEKQRIQS